MLLRRNRSSIGLKPSSERQRAIENEFTDPLVEKVVRGARYTMLKSDGGSFLGELSVSTIQDDSGKPGAFIGVTRDVTERVFAEEQLQLQAAALETTANAIMVTDTQGIIQLVNQAFCKLTGYDREEVLGQNTRILKSDHHDQPFYEQLWKTITAGEVWHGVLTRSSSSSCRVTPMVRTISFPWLDGAPSAEEPASPLQRRTSWNEAQSDSFGR